LSSAWRALNNLVDPALRDPVLAILTREYRPLEPALVTFYTRLETCLGAEECEEGLAKRLFCLSAVHDARLYATFIP
jgi:hypothetical protein